MILISLLLIIAAGCRAQPDAASPAEAAADAGSISGPIALNEGQKLQVVATTNIVGDVVRQVAGDRIDLSTLMKPGVDPHTYVATPADVAAVHDAHVLFASGAGLESFLDEMMANAGGQAIRIDLSNELELRELPEDHDRGSLDPHVWFDVQHVVAWAQTAQEALAALDPSAADAYRANAEAYVGRLRELDGWIQEQVAAIPQSNRKLVTNHPAFGYFAARYGLEQIGAVYPISPSGEPSARDLAALQDTIRQYRVPALFTESTVNPNLAEQVARDTGVQIVSLYSGSLGEPGSGVESYVDLMRYDTRAIVEALQ